jgi:glycosyltransferase involved in cell wall biosynthesis
MCRDLAVQLATRGHEVIVVTMGATGCEEVERRDGVTVFRTKVRRARRDRCTLREMTRFIVAALELILAHPEWRQRTLSHAHFVLPGGFVAWCLNRWFGMPYILASHGSDVLGHNPRFRFVYPFVASVWKRIVARASLVTAASDRLAERIAGAHTRACVLTVPNTVDAQRFVPSVKQRRILVVGRLVASKSVGEIIAALSLVNLRGWHVDVIGDGPLRASLQNQAVAAGLSRKLTFHGWLENGGERMCDLYGRAYLYVSASRLENMSVALLQALSAGCRIVTTGAGASVAGHIRSFAPGNVRELAGLISDELRLFTPGASPVPWTPQVTVDGYVALLDVEGWLPIETDPVTTSVIGVMRARASTSSTASEGARLRPQLP